jgi:phage replication initiation protein
MNHKRLNVLVDASVREQLKFFSSRPCASRLYFTQMPFVSEGAERTDSPQACRGDEARAALPPSTNRGGKSLSPKKSKIIIRSFPMRAIVDWCTCTFQFCEEDLKAFLGHLARVTGLQLVMEERRGRPGYQNGMQIRALVNFEMVNFAVLAWGGDSQRGRAMLDLSGACCGCISDWVGFQCFLESLDDSRLTRVDLAVDLFNGEFTVDDACEWRKEGLFNVGGRSPSSSLAGDWLEEKEGRTLYIGKAKNGKGLRVYEKGKQLGDLLSQWVRFEVQFGNRDRVLPFAMLTESEKYFVAAYPALEKIVVCGGESIKTTQTTAAISITTILDALKRTYGKWIHVLASSGIDITDLVEGVTVTALPARVQSSAVVAGVLRDTCKSSFEKWSN